MNRTALAFVAGILLATGVVHAGGSAAPVDDKEHKENQPHMRAALESLRTAKDQLEKASADKGGHRKNAIDLVAKAIDEVRAGIDADNANGKDNPKK